ncbi:hypothetical protein BASA81_000989 [Batrachochytrium salamandrivorans]|nr:hypothetical protein BASA81_000989 [Batrachochytrium salamandrivorans]
MDEERLLAGDFVHGGMNRRYLFVKGTVPDVLAIAIHPFGGSAETTFRFEGGALVKLGFSVLVPEGYRNSWNAGHCCGEAKAKAINDVGFVYDLAKFVIQEHVKPGTVGGVKVYLTGYSNGAFIVSKLALMQQQLGENGKWISAIAMQSGYSYELDLYDNAVGEQPLPVFAIHGGADTYVNPGGCCATTAPKACCCGITSDICVSFSQSLSLWRQINRCDTKKSTSKLPFANVTEPDAKCEFNLQCGVYSCLFPNQAHRLNLEEHEGGVPNLVAEFFHFDYVHNPNSHRFVPSYATRLSPQHTQDLAYIALGAALGLLLIGVWIQIVKKGRLVALAAAAAKHRYSKVSQNQDSDDDDGDS